MAGVDRAGVSHLAKRAIDTLGMGRAARMLWNRRPRARRRRRFASWIQEADRRDNEGMRLVLASVLTEESNCVDIGAAAGEFLREMVELAPRGHHIAYEPLSTSFDLLNERFPEADLRRAAVSNVGGGNTRFAHVRSAPGWSGLRAYAMPLAQPDVETIDVPTVTLDDDLPPDYVPTLIKIDVNGAEGLVLEGAVRTLAAHRPIVIFEHGRAAAAYGMTSEDIFRFLVAGCRLRVFDLEGSGPFDADDFRRAVGTKWNFLARP